MRIASTLFLLPALFAACISVSPEPDWGRPLPPGAPALLPLGPDDPRPDFASQWADRDALLEQAGRSLNWFDKPSSKEHFPVEGVTHAQARASVERFERILQEATDPDDFARAMEESFEVFKSAGWDGDGGGVLFTGYCTPILDADVARGGDFVWPLYGLPPDLVKGPKGEILGQRQPDGSMRPYPDRKTIETEGLLEGQGLELVFLRSPLDAYIAHVNGSAILRLRDGRLMRVGYAGKNGLGYVSLRDELVRDRKLDRATANLDAIRRWARARPDDVQAYLWRNPSYVFFMPIDGFPRGSLNIEVSAERTLATDKTIFPRGGLVFVDTALADAHGGRLPFQRLMFDHDTGGAIRTAGRADIYLGRGVMAERLAGSTRAEGQLYYLFLRS